MIASARSPDQGGALKKQNDRPRRACVVALIACLSVGLLASPAAAERVRVKRIGRGVVLKEIQRWKPRLRIKVASVSRRARGRIRTVLAGGRLPGLERTSSIARRKRAVVAINGDYARKSGRPVMAFAQGGRLVQTPLTWGRNFAMSRDGKSVFIGHPHVEVTLSHQEIGSIAIKRVNQGAPTRRTLGLFTNHGGELERPPRRGCHARLVPGGIPRRAANGGLRIRYEVGVVRCGRRLRPLNGAVVSARRRGPKAEVVRSLRGANPVALNWSLGWNGAYQTVGGNPTLVEQGRIVVGRSKSDPFFRRHPRTGVGVNKRGNIFFVTVDGRQKRSRGMTLRGFARFFRSLGARWALNLDGGGSTTMFARGRVLNDPSDGRERPVSSALVVLRRGQTRTAGRSGTLAAREEAVPASGVWEEMVADPASTGGLADSLSGRGKKLPKAMRSAARAFRRH
jgi:hypothetical protein